MFKESNISIPSLPQVLVIGGTGRNSGKTTLSCKIIKQFKDIGLTAIKISPHFHDPDSNLEPVVTNCEYNIFKETSFDGHKDSSLMLSSGAFESYYIQTHDYTSGAALECILRKIKPLSPVVCESPAIRRFIKPGVFILSDNSEIGNKKDPGILLGQANMVYLLQEHHGVPEKLGFSNGVWTWVIK
jgi:hypothetical protein